MPSRPPGWPIGRSLEAPAARAGTCQPTRYRCVAHRRRIHRCRRPTVCRRRENRTIAIRPLGRRRLCKSSSRSLPGFWRSPKKRKLSCRHRQGTSHFAARITSHLDTFDADGLKLPQLANVAHTQHFRLWHLPPNGNWRTLPHWPQVSARADSVWRRYESVSFAPFAHDATRCNAPP